MITFTCDLCGKPGVPRTGRGPAFVDNYSLPEVVYQNIHIVFSASKVPPEHRGDKMPPFMVRNDHNADLCRECLVKAIENGHELTREDFDGAPVTP